MTTVHLRFGALFLMTLALLLPGAAQARVVGDTSVAYSAERVLTVNGQRFDGMLYAIPGFQRHEQLVGGIKQAAILDLESGHGYFIVPAVRSFIDFPIDRAVRELSTPDMLGPPQGTERVNGVTAVKYRVDHHAADGTHTEGTVWLAGNGIPMRGEGAVTEPGGRRTPFSWRLSSVHVAPQDPGLFAPPDGFYRLPVNALPGILGGAGN
jgi:hypothetical protein